MSWYTRPRASVLGGISILILAFGGFAPDADAQTRPKVHFEIAAQPLAQALRQFAIQSKRQVIFNPAAVPVRHAPSVAGDLPPEEALKMLLEGTGLGFTVGTGDTLVIAPTGAAGDSPRNLTGTSSTSIQPAPAATTTDDRAVLAEVVVTAQKRAERLEDVPVSMGVQTALDLDRFHPLQMTDYAGYVAGLDVTTGGWPGTNQITLRGLSQQGGDTPVVATYFDDVPIGASGPGALGAVLAPDVNPFDLERVEVLRGPQGTLWGSNSIGGIVRFVLTKPELDKFTARAGADLIDVYNGNGIGYTARGAVNVPLIEGRLALHASVSRTDNPGYINNALTGKKGENRESVQNERLSLLWQLTDRLSLKAQALSQHTDAGSTFVTLSAEQNVGGYANAPGSPIYGDLTSFHALPNSFVADLKFFSVTVDWNSDIGNLVSTSGYSIQKFTQQSDITDYGRDADVLPITGVGSGYELAVAQYQVRKFTQEIRFVSPTEQRLQWMLGAFYDNDKVDPFTTTQFGYDAQLNPIPGFPVLYAMEIPSSYSETAVFGNVTYQFTRAFDITAGLRRGVTRASYAQMVSGPGWDLCCGGAAGVDAAGDSRTNITGYSFTPRFRWSADGMIYGRVATGFRPGGPNILSPSQIGSSTAPKQYGSDSDVNYEIGLKVDFLSHRLQLDAAAFRIDWTDIQFYMPFTAADGSVVYANVNGGKARSDGVELSVKVLPTKGLQVTATYAHYDPRFEADNPMTGFVKGQPIPGVAPSTASLLVEYTLPLDSEWKATIGGGLRHKAEIIPYPDPTFYEDDRAKATTLTDINASLSFHSWRAALYVRNVADKRAYGPVTSNLQTTNPAYGPAFNGAVTQPRTVGLSFDKSF
ncbi:MAG: TonB-dependent receptor [Proteobacteria bacterium]|nr:TonB-dependent receptor [Pseudomonadota bacterium]